MKFLFKIFRFKIFRKFLTPKVEPKPAAEKPAAEKPHVDKKVLVLRDDFIFEHNPKMWTIKDTLPASAAEIKDLLGTLASKIHAAEFNETGRFISRAAVGIVFWTGGRSAAIQTVFDFEKNGETGIRVKHLPEEAEKLQAAVKQIKAFLN